MRLFKNALCLASRPDVEGKYATGYWQRCHRHTQHEGRHRVVFRDGGVREWNTGDFETELTRQPEVKP